MSIRLDITDETVEYLSSINKLDVMDFKMFHLIPQRDPANLLTYTPESMKFTTSWTHIVGEANCTLEQFKVIQLLPEDLWLTTMYALINQT